MFYAPFKLELLEHAKISKGRLQSESLLIKLSYTPSTYHEPLISFYIFFSKIGILLATPTISI